MCNWRKNKQKKLCFSKKAISFKKITPKKNIIVLLERESW